MPELNRFTEGQPGNPEVVRTKRRKRGAERRVVSGGLSVLLYQLIGVAIFIGAWEAVARSGVINSLLLAPPSRVAESIVDLARQGELWGNIWVTVKEALIGFGIGVVVGALLGFVIGLSPVVTNLLNPFITMLNSTPRIALAPLFVLWFGIGMTSRVVLVFSLVVFIVLTNTMSGTQSVDPDYLTLAKLLSARRRQIIVKIALPSVLPWILAAMRVAFAWAIAGAVVGEMFLGQDGLGYLIVAGSGVFNIAQIFASLVITVAIAYIADRVLWRSERYILRWRD